MKKYICLLLIGTVSAFLMSGCGEKNQVQEISSEQTQEVKPTQEETAEKSESETWNPESDETVEQAASVEENENQTQVDVEMIRGFYQNILDDYIAFYKGEKPYNQTEIYRIIGNENTVLNYGTYNNSWLGAYDETSCFDESYSEYMYSNMVSLDARFCDLNGDGVEELLIVESDDSYNTAGMIHDVWAIVDGNPTYVGYFDSRYDLILTKEDILIETLSSGWNSSAYSTLSFQSDGYFQIVDLVEQIPEGEGSIYQHNQEKIDEEEFQTLVDSYFDYERKDLSLLDGINIGRWEK